VAHTTATRGSTAVRIDSNLPQDERHLDASTRENIYKALKHIGAARELIADAVGADRILELERQNMQQQER
jgi:hypothetical protein